MKKILLILAGSFFLVATGNAYADVITFDDLPPIDPVMGGDVPNGYAGFNWNNFGYLGRGPFAESGYINGLVSAPFAGLNSFANPASFTTTDDSAFTLTSLFLTAAWHDGLNVEIIGSRNGTVLDAQNFIVSPTGPTLETLDWSGIDTVSISTSGGTIDPNYEFEILDVEDTQVVIDDITINGLDSTPAVPEPSTFVLLGTGILGLVGVRRKLLLNP